MNNVSTAFDFIFIKKNYFQREILLLKISVILCRKQKAVGRILSAGLALAVQAGSGNSSRNYPPLESDTF